MRQSIAVLPFLASAAVAADVISFYFPAGTLLVFSNIECSNLTIPGSEGVDPVATIKTVQPSTTVMKLACPTGVDSNDCGWGIGLDYTILSGTHYQAQMTDDGFSMSFGCDHNTMASEMKCTLSVTGGNDDTLGPQTVSFKGDEIAFNKATVVQGANLLSGAGGSATVSATPAASAGSGLVTAATPSATGSSMRSIQSSISGAKQSATGSATPAQSTGSAAKYGIEGSALLFFAGAVAVNAL